MANQRSKDKAQINFHPTKVNKAKLQQIASQRKCALSDILNEIIENFLTEIETEKNNENISLTSETTETQNRSSEEKNDT